MINKNQLTVKSLKELLDKLSANGCDDMTICLGNDTPLLEDAISLDYISKRLLLRNTYYDKTMVDAAREFKNTIDSAIQGYIHKCYYAGRFIKYGEVYEKALKAMKDYSEHGGENDYEDSILENKEDWL